MKGKIMSCLVLFFMFSSLCVFGQSSELSKQAYNTLIEEVSVLKSQIDRNNAPVATATGSSVISQTKLRLAIIRDMFPALKEGNASVQSVLDASLQKFRSRFQNDQVNANAVTVAGDYLNQLLIKE